MIGVPGLVCPIGDSLPKIAAAIDASISAFKHSEFVGLKGEAFKSASVPEATLEPWDAIAQYSVRQNRILRLGTTALKTLLPPPIALTSTIPLLLCLPEPYPHHKEAYGPEIISTLAKSSNWPINLPESRYFLMGRTSGFYALSYAQRLLSETPIHAVILGAIDSYLDPLLLALMEKDGRVLRERNSVGFIPGEAACFMVVAKKEWAEQHHIPMLGFVGSTGVAEEPGHLYSQTPNLGNGLSGAIRHALTGVEQFKFLYSSCNGEPMLAKELGIALTRNHTKSASFKHIHPADCMGDVGAATVPLLMGIAALKQKEISLIAASSDGPFRGAVCVRGI